MKQDEGDGMVGRPPSDVLILTSRVRPAGRTVLTEIEDHWRDLRAASGFLPRRSEVDASRMAAALPHAFVLERVAPGVARFRIAGRAVAGVMGGEPKGLPLSMAFAAASRPSLQNWLDRCFDAPALVELLIEAPQGGLRQPLRGRLLLLPLLDENGQVARALGGLLLDGVPRRSNIRFDLSDAVPRVETVPHPAPKRVFADPAGSAALPGLRETERPYLRLVVPNS